MKSKDIRLLFVPGLLESKDLGAAALAFQQTKCLLLREICAQLAEANELKQVEIEARHGIEFVKNKLMALRGVS